MPDFISTRLETGVTRGTTYFADPRQLYVDWSKNLSRGGQEPAVDDALIELARDMMPKVGSGDEPEGTSGQLNPVLVRIGKPYQVVGGFRRMRAALWLIESGTCTDFKVMYTIANMTEAEAAVINVSENLNREDPNPIQLAHAIRGLHENYGMPIKTIAARFKRSTTYVNNLMGLLSLPKAIQSSVTDNRTTVTAAIELAKLPEHKQMQAFEEASTGDAKVTPARVKAASSTVEDGPKPRKLKELRAYLTERSPVSALDDAFGKLMLSFLDGTATARDLDDFRDDVFQAAKAAGVSSTVEMVPGHGFAQGG